MGHFAISSDGPFAIDSSTNRRAADGGIALRRFGIRRGAIGLITVSGSAIGLGVIGQLIARDLYNGSTDLYSISWRGV